MKKIALQEVRDELPKGIDHLTVVRSGAGSLTLSWPAVTLDVDGHKTIVSSYALYGRLVARHLGKHIPGQPIVVAQNMPGAGSLKAANYIYDVAPRAYKGWGEYEKGTRELFKTMKSGSFMIRCRSNALTKSGTDGNAGLSRPSNVTSSDP